MELKLVLKDGTNIPLEEAGYNINHCVVNCNDRAAFQAIWNKLTPDNLSEVELTDNGNTVQTITGLTLNGTQTVENPDGTLTGHFYFGGGTVIHYPSDNTSVSEIETDDVEPDKENDIPQNEIEV